jgi:hypothetical protein
MLTKNTREVPVTLPAFVVFVFLALLSRDWGLCSHGGVGGGRKGKRIRDSSSGSEAVLALTTKKSGFSKKQD